MHATRRTAAVAFMVVAFAFGCRPPPPAGYLDALAVLDRIPVANERGAGYDRDRFGYPAGGGLTSCDTRALVLIDESMEQVRFAPAFCAFSGGRWHSAYDGVTTTNIQDLEIDHVVALKEAWDSGAFAWDDARLVAFANDLTDDRTLIAVTVASNRQKADSDPSN